MKIKRLCIIIIATAILFTSTSFAYAASEKEYGIISYNKDTENVSFFSTLPELYQKDFDNVWFNGGTVAENGNLLVCLCMLASYYQQHWILPSDFIAEYSEYISDDGNIDIYGASNAFLESNAHITIETFDFKKASEYLINDSAIILLRIKNPSIYSEYSTYLILTGIGDGYISVRDPIYQNLEKHSYNYDDYAGYYYSAYDVLISAGNDTTMYVYH